MLTLPARKMTEIVLVFKSNNSDEHLTPDLKIKLRNAAKKHKEYSTSVTVSPLVTGRDDNGHIIEIDSIGKWIFGTPGYKGHIRTVFLQQPERVSIELCDKTDIIVNLILNAAKDIDLVFLYAYDFKSKDVIKVGDYILEILKTIWDQINKSFDLIQKDVGKQIGEFDINDYILTINKVGSWTGDKDPLPMEEILFLDTYGRETVEGQEIYATLAKNALQKLGITDNHMILRAFGEFYGSLCSGWSGRFGNIDDIIRKMENVYTEPDNIIHHLQGGEDLFDSDEVKKRLLNVVKVIEDPTNIL